MRERAREINRLHKPLEDTGIKRDCVASDVPGVSGRAMLTQPRAGEREASKLAGRVKDRRCVRRDALAGVHFASRATQYPGNRQSAGKPNRW